MAITLSRLLPIQNGYVKIPRGETSLAGRLRPKDLIDAIPGAKIVQVGPSGRRYVSISSVSAGTDVESWALFDYPRYDFFVELPSVDVRSTSSQDDDFATAYGLA